MKECTDTCNKHTRQNVVGQEGYVTSVNDVQ